MKFIKTLATICVVAIFSTGCFHNDSGSGGTTTSPQTYGFFRVLQPKLSNISEMKVGTAASNQSVTMSIARTGHKTIELSGGKFMLVGGEVADQHGKYSPSVIDIFDSSTETFTKLNTVLINSRRWKSDGSQSFALLKLPDGNIMIMGGLVGIEDTVEIFNTTTQDTTSFKDVFPVPVNNVIDLFYMGNNKVLIVGAWFTAINMPEFKGNFILDLVTMKATVLPGEVITSRNNAVQLADNSIIYAGGQDNNYTSHNEIWKIDATTLILSQIGSMKIPRQDYGMTLLPDGRIGVYGGNNRLGAYSEVIRHKSVEIIDPTTGTSSYSIDLLAPRASTLAIKLENGFVLNAGGSNETGNLVGDEFVHNHLTNISGTTGNLNTARRFYSVVHLNNGKVLISGGSGNYDDIFNTAEIYDPNLKLIISYDTSTNILVGQVIHFSSDASGVTWNCSTGGTINANGIFTATATGKVTVTATSGINTAMVIITVSAIPE